MPQLAHNSAPAPNEVKLEGQWYRVEWDRLGTAEWEVSCVFPGATAPLVGFGFTVDEALEDLRRAHREFLAFNDESSENWWAASYL